MVNAIGRRLKPLEYAKESKDINNWKFFSMDIHWGGSYEYVIDID